MILNNKIPKLEIVASKAKAFLLEAAGNLRIVGTNLVAKYNWVGLQTVDKIQKGLSRPVIKPYWHVRLSEK